MTKANRQRRVNLRRSLDRHREGNPLASPLWGPRFDAWREGLRRAARVGKRSHHDLDRGHERVPSDRERRYRCAAATFAPPALPAQQPRWARKHGHGSGLATLRPVVAGQGGDE